MALSLIRNSRVFFTSNVDSLGAVQATGFTVFNTQEIQVLDGFSFSQATNAETVTLNEAGAVPVRGQRSFNSSLAPVDFSFSTYVRPAKYGTGPVWAEERYLWNALLFNASTPYYIGSNSAVGAWSSTATEATAFVGSSDKHQLLPFGLIIALDNTTFVIDNCCMDQVSIDFGIDQIATLAWTGKGGTLRRLSSAITLNDAGGFTGSFAPTGAAHVGFSNGFTGSARAKDTQANYIANKLSTAYIASGLNAFIGSSTNPQYNIPITGGNLTFSNNVTYLTPANLGTVNTPFTYFTGTRAVSGTLTAYLKTGAFIGSNMSGDAGALFSALTTPAALANPEPKYSMYVDIGGLANSTRLSLNLPGTLIQIPSVKSESVISTDINFTAQGQTGQSYDIEKAGEITVQYRSVTL